MKKLVYLVVLLLVFSVGVVVFAAEGNPGVDGGVKELVPALVEVGPYASVIAQRLEFDHFAMCWSWRNWRFEGGWYWDDTVEPGMDFGYYSGKAGEAKFTDSNGFVVETNTALALTFEGVPLTHESGDTMLTTYWAFTTAGVDPVWPVPNWQMFPAQVIPKSEIGFFGTGKVPRNDGGFRWTSLLDGVRHIVTGIESGTFWPTQDDVHAALSYNGIVTNGIYAFQVFGFAGTDEISSQREGDYEGLIKLTVAKQ